MLTPVAEGVLVHQSQLLRNNTVVVRGRAGVLLVDPGITGEEMACLARDLRELGEPVVAGFATHPDWDHVLWHPALGEAPRYGTTRCAEVMRELRSDPGWRDLAAGALPPEIADDVPLEPFGLLRGLSPGTVELPWDGPRVRVVEHPAHAVGHAALLVEDSGVLVAGDMLSDVFPPMLGDLADTDDPVSDYHRGLGLLEELVDQVDVVVPGHGSVGFGDALRDRVALDRSYLHALTGGRAPDDPRIQAPDPGWEWVSDIHRGQVDQVAAVSHPPDGR